MPESTRKRVMGVPREPIRVRSITDAEQCLWMPKGARYDSEGERQGFANLIRNYGPLTVELPARPPLPEVEHLPRDRAITVPDLLRNGDSLTGLLAYLASECMQDNPDDEQIVRDMHDVIGVAGQLQAIFHLLERRI